MRESWVRLEAFPQYAISDQGSILNIKRDTIRTPSINRDGIVCVGLRGENSRIFNRSVALLVLDTFAPERPLTYNSVIHRDADKLNCTLDNLFWRPRWFAGRYHMQFERPWFHESNAPFENLDTGQQFEGFKEECMQHGVRAMEIQTSSTNGWGVFPTGHTYRRL